MNSERACPVQATSAVFAGKWKVRIIWHLGFGPRRFAELRRHLPGVSEKVLAEQLRQLERDGVLLRHASDGFPRRVDYELSPSGIELLRVMERMCDWASAYLGVTPTLPLLPPILALAAHA